MLITAFASTFELIKNLFTTHNLDLILKPKGHLNSLEEFPYLVGQRKSNKYSSSLVLDMPL